MSRRTPGSKPCSISVESFYLVGHYKIEDLDVTLFSENLPKRAGQRWNQATADVRDQLAGWAPNRALDAFARVLRNAAELDRIEHVLLFFEKPYNWHREYTAWVDSGKPVGPEDHGWDVFLEALVEL